MKNTYKIIAKFKDEGKEYFIILINKSKILFVCCENKKLRLDLTDEEFHLVNSIYKSLLINEDTSIEIEEKTVNAKVFKVFYDTNSKNFFWKLKNPKQKITPYDNIALNFIYNHNQTILCGFSYEEDEEDNSDENVDQEFTEFINKVRKVGKKLFTVFVVADLVLFGMKIPIINTPHGKDSILEYVISSENTEYNYEKIRKAIDSNPNLTISEKEFLNKFKFVFDEDHEFMDLEMIESRLGSLKINYLQESSGTTVAATYNMSKNKIDVYETTDFENTDIRIITHEIGHVFQRGGGIWFASELSDELWTRETLRKMYNKGIINKKERFKNALGTDTLFGNGYNQQMYLYYILASMVPEEELKKFQYSCDDSDLVNSLTKENKVKPKEVYRLLGDMNSLRNFDKKSKLFILKEDGEQAFRKCYKELNELYNKTKGMDINADLGTAITYFDSGQPYRIGEDDPAFFESLDMLIREYLQEKHGDEKDKKYFPGSLIYSLPVTYLSSDYQNAEIAFDTEIESVSNYAWLKGKERIIITDETKDKYRNYYENIKDYNDQQYIEK